MPPSTKARPAPPPYFDDDTIIGKAYDPHITRRLLTYLRPYRRQLLMALVFMVASTLASISGPYLIKVALDSGIAAGNLGVLGQTVVLYLLAAGVLWMSTFLRIRIMAVTGQSIIYDLRRE